MKIGLPKLQELGDIRKYLLIIETLELERLNNVMLHPTALREQAQVHDDLKGMREYHAEMSQFLFRKQNEHRNNQFEQSFVLEMQNFLDFWSRTLDNFKQVANEEIAAAIDKNEVLKEEFNELMEKHLGFRPPANSTFLSLQAIRKVVAKLRLNDAYEFINFEYFKRFNIKLNEGWIRDRRLTIIKKMDIFEKRLNEVLRTLRERLALELQKLHVKRLRQYDMLMVKYMKLKNHISELNSKEMIELKKHQRFYDNRVAQTTFFHKNDMFLKAMSGTAEQDVLETGPFALTDTALNSTAPKSVLKTKSAMNDRALTPNKDVSANTDMKGVGRVGKSHRMTSAVINFGPKANDFGSQQFLGDIDIAQMVKDKKRKTVKI